VGTTTVEIYSPVLGVINVSDTTTTGEQVLLGFELFNITHFMKWSIDTGIVNAVDNRLIGVYNIQDYLVLISLETGSFDFRTTKVFTNGLTSQKVTSVLPGTPTPITGQTFVRTSSLFNKYIFAGYTSDLTGPVTYPGASITMFSGSVTSTIGAGSQPEFSRYQHVEDVQDGVQYVTYRHDSLGLVVEKRKPDGSPHSPPKIVVIDANGYNSSIHVFGPNLFICYTILNITLTEYVTFVVKRLSKATLDVFWEKTRTFSDSSLDTFYPRITDVDKNIHVLFIRNNDGVYSDIYNVRTGKTNTPDPYDLGLEMEFTDKREFSIAKSQILTSGFLFVYTGFPTSDGSIHTAKYTSLSYINQWEATID
jgi:hypothetical protein